jgi:hypothetical protein
VHDAVTPFRHKEDEVKRYGLCCGLIAVTAVLANVALASDDVGSRPWQVEASAFFPQEEAKALMGSSMFQASVVRDLKAMGDAYTSVGATWLRKTHLGGEISTGGLFVRQTWFGHDGSPAVGGPFAGFDVGIFASRVKTPSVFIPGDDDDGTLIPGDNETRLGVGAGLFLGYQFGERLSVKGGYSVFPPAAQTSISGFTLTVGYRF